jgi:putative membrane protein
MSRPEDSPGGLLGSLRVLLGGLLMGFANLVPGLSGGTMILAIGLYDRFIGAVAEVTRLRPTRSTIVFLTVLVLGLAIAVVGLATPAVWLVTQHRWVAYSLFIGMTLGGIPNLWPLVKPRAPAHLPVTILSIAAGVAVMIVLAWGLRDTALPQTTVVFVLVGALAASSMILPGISGSYILLILGLYDVVVGSLRSEVLREDLGGAMTIIVPVVIGAVLGIGLLSNVLKLLLARFERSAHGVLLGLLVGSVFGLVPFQEAVHPDLVTRSGNKAVAALVQGESCDDVNAEHGTSYDQAQAAELAQRYAGMSRGELKRLGQETEYYSPSAPRAGLALLILATGFAVTLMIGRMGKKEDAAGST